MAKIATLFQRSAAEAVGTFFLVFIGAGSVIAAQIAGGGGAGLLIAAFGNGIALALAVTLSINISGGHINPAVSLVMAALRKISPRDALVYIIAQLVGGIIGGLSLVLLYPSAAAGIVSYGAPVLAQGVGALTGIGVEAVLTFILVFTILCILVDRRGPKITGFAPGLAVFIDVLAGGALTGAAMNPARAMGPMIATGFFSNWYVYWIGPIVGAIVAALIYKYAIAER
ncbi:MAG: aquaporin [Candidatus Micrarchaeota archaeon]|nr:aquaporin [Candidatus Micrarchaeota archaeon]MDE1804740.1 aquaporin [Candidatus Micrarchaeota archaeon]MDE1847007.1 aquaporin [Candidatus Micrarchaeota archaeon]